MQVRDVMTTDYKVVKPEATIKEAASFMLSADTGSLPVCDGERILGMITDRDIAVRAVAEGRDCDSRVSDFMTSDVVTARDSDDTAAIAQRMTDSQVRRLPVIDENDRLVGIVSLGDLARAKNETASSAALEGVSAEGGKHKQS